MVTNADFDRTRQCVDYYRKLGLCPLPSRMDVKGPMLATYAEHYGPTPVPSWVYEKWATTNVQILTGVKTPTPTKIIVVDLDGTEAIDAWDRIAFQNGFGANAGWIAQTGSGGRHHYFLLPDGITECASGIIWGFWDTFGQSGKGAWVKHKEIRILADSALVVAPPSVHVDTGNRYEWHPSLSPKRKRLPMLAPDWLLAMPRLTAPSFVEPKAPRREPADYIRKSDRYYTREEVIEAIGNSKFDIATREWGLVSTVNGPNPNGWCACYIPGRENPGHSRPSGSFNFFDGTLQDRKDLSSISFFDLGVVLGVYHTWQECRDAMGDRFVGGKTQHYKYSY